MGESIMAKGRCVQDTEAMEKGRKERTKLYTETEGQKFCICVERMKKEEGKKRE